MPEALKRRKYFIRWKAASDQAGDIGGELCPSLVIRETVRFDSNSVEHLAKEVSDKTIARLADTDKASSDSRGNDGCRGVVVVS